MPSKLKSRKQPFTLRPLKVNVIIGTDKSMVTPTTSPLRMNGSSGTVSKTKVLWPPVHK